MNIYKIRLDCFFEEMRQFKTEYGYYSNFSLNNFLHFLLKDENGLEEINYLLSSYTSFSDKPISPTLREITDLTLKDLLTSIDEDQISFETNFKNYLLNAFLSHKNFDLDVLNQIKTNFIDKKFQIEHQNQIKIKSIETSAYLRDLTNIFYYDETYYQIMYNFINYLQNKDLNLFIDNGIIYLKNENDKNPIYWEELNQIISQIYLQIIRHKNNFLSLLEQGDFYKIFDKLRILPFDLNKSLMVLSEYEIEKGKTLLKSLLEFKLKENKEQSFKIILTNIEQDFILSINDENYKFTYLFDKMYSALLLNLKISKLKLKENTYTFYEDSLFTLEQSFIDYCVSHLEQLKFTYNNEFKYIDYLLHFFQKTRFDNKVLKDFIDYFFNRKKNKSLSLIPFNSEVPKQINNSEKLEIELFRSDVVLLLGDRKQAFHLIQSIENKNFFHFNHEDLNEDHIVNLDLSILNQELKESVIYLNLSKYINVANIVNLLKLIKNKTKCKLIINFQSESEDKLIDQLKDLNIKYVVNSIKMDEYNKEQLDNFISFKIEQYLPISHFIYSKKFLIDCLKKSYYSSNSLLEHLEKVVSFIKNKTYLLFSNLNDEQLIFLAEEYKVNKENETGRIVLNEEFIQFSFSKVSSLYQEKQENFNQFIDDNLLKELQPHLNNIIFDQQEVISQITDKLYLFKTGLSQNGVEKPISSFIFAGKTGTGKTELAKQLAKFLNLNFVRIDMSEYKLEHYQSNLLGSPSGYVGSNKKGLLLRELENNPYSVILFDEIEKAHKNIFELFLQILDYATLTDASTGKKIDFSKSIIIFTTNLGAVEDLKFGLHSNYDKQDENLNFNNMKKSIYDELYSKFSPEFLGRLDNILVFKDLKEETYLKIINYELDKIQEVLNNKKIKILFKIKEDDLIKEANLLNISEKLLSFLKNKKETKHIDILGAREMKNLIQQEISIPLSKILFENNNLTSIEIIIDNNKLDFLF